MNKIALCHCGGVLIFTLYFQEKQFLCLKCGNLYQSPPRAQDSTPEGEAKWRALESEFMTNCGSKLIVVGLYRDGCARCLLGEETHMHHATPEDWRACNDALYWLSERTGREFHLINGSIYTAKEAPA